MVVRPSSSPASPGTAPAEFRDAVAGLRAAVLRPEVLAEEMPAPQRIAPYAAALTADVTLDDDEIGTGRIIVLHDPAGNDAWAGTFRCVAYVRCDLEPEMVADPLLGQVGWDWLLESLEGHGALHVAAAGSVTKVATEGFGGMADEGSTAQIEVRASWTPVTGDDVAAAIAAHVEGWGQLLCTAAGLEPVPDGVAVMPSRRGQRGTTGR